MAADIDLVGDVRQDIAPDLGPGGEEGIDSAAEDLAPSDFVAPAAKAQAAASPAPAAAAGSGFDFGLAAPAAAPAAPSPSPSSASSFDFGFATPAEKPKAVAAPAPASGGFDFGGLGECEQPSTVEMAPPTAAMIAAGGDGDGDAIDFDAPGPAADAASMASPFGGPDEGENLLGLGSDDIDAMLDGIIRDVGSDDASGASQLEAADTNIPLFSHLAVGDWLNP